MRSSEEDPQCTDNEAFERAIRHEMLLHDVVIAEGFQVAPLEEKVIRLDSPRTVEDVHAHVLSILQTIQLGR
eukprot:jgi/Chrpa1/14599/Chrysochromulina_OHIO_Genome00018741-RA